MRSMVEGFFPTPKNPSTALRAVPPPPEIRGRNEEAASPPDRCATSPACPRPLPCLRFPWPQPGRPRGTATARLRRVGGSGRAAALDEDAAVEHVDDSSGIIGMGGRVGDHDDGRTLAVERLEHLHHLLA